MDLGNAADVVQVLSGLTIVGGAVFGMVQLSELRRQRQGSAAYAFFQQWDSQRSDDLDVVYGLKDDTPAADIEGDPTIRLAANHVYEWFQWLAERLAERKGRDETVGAHEAYRDWKG